MTASGRASHRASHRAAVIGLATGSASVTAPGTASHSAPGTASHGASHSAAGISPAWRRRCWSSPASIPAAAPASAADIPAIAAQGAHALPVATALTVQDNNRVHAVRPVETEFVLHQAQALIDTCAIRAVKIGIPGNRANALAIAGLLRSLRKRDPKLPVVLDPVLASGHGDALASGDPLDAVAELLALATIVLPNEPEACAIGAFPGAQWLVTGGHGDGQFVTNRWYANGQLEQRWRWPRLPGAYHGSGCTLAAALAARLALGESMFEALGAAQSYCHEALAQAFAIAPGQRIPRRFLQRTGQDGVQALPTT
ncbi:bifunctional hydroxymethylpyrimidine kinase/phosphomethylpyrimidine kinase [Massilia sp. Se16.2.3]|uniref:bifunctional hydroxymethylpyrimidine kinase/phosphomethylpyrimidine kinase n=1 Tax=Massilia sp. Se16.2.3 TaxID=2709303 RepID=UPI0028041649|nr:bifunctional hydroxymethylpyrimidine kinase/phosphomethylpyrimidine kinase [Massilia sp. Se16.2.3]